MISTQPQVIAITDAVYSGGYALRLTFSDGTVQRVDFEPFLRSARNPAIRDFLDVERFKSFRIECGDLMWGDFELCFPIIELYQGKVS